MRSTLLVTLFMFITSLSFAQQKNNEPAKKFKFFNRTGLSYTFGLNETFPNQKVNALHVKTVVGLAMSQVGFGIGLENGSFKSSTGSGANFNTLAFTGNLHVLAKPIETKELNFFAKGAAGYAVRISRYYDKGLTYEGAVGGILTTKKGGRYFLQALYNYQSFDDFSNASGKIYVQSIGLGIGSWF